MARSRLGDILIKEGLITESQLNEALLTQKDKKIPIGESLIKIGAINEEDLVKALGTQMMIPYCSYASGLLKPKPDQELDKIVPHEFAMKHLVLPLAKEGQVLTCAVFDPLDLVTIDNLKKITGCELVIYVATKSDLTKVINEFYFFDPNKDHKNSMLDKAVEKTYQGDQPSSKMISADSPMDAELSIDRLIEKAEDATVVKLVDLIIRQAIDEKASDVHIEPFKERLEIRYRIDGALYQIPPPASHLHLPIISRIKILAKMDIAEKRMPQDGSISAKLEDRTVDIRVSTLPTVWGEKVVLRLLDKGAVKLELTQLGFDNKQLELIRKALKSPYGLFFVTGPTGSGKSTTLYGALNEIIDPSKNILTVEDPVEFKIEGVNQVGVRTDIGLTFAAVLKAFLRQDPDIIMVGEVRDLETAQICVRAGLTGHLVLSTLHTNDAPSAITRLIDIGVPSYLLTPSLLMIIGQRLARKLCTKCRETYGAAGQMVGNYKIKSDLIYRAKGCDDCNHTGYKGRFVISEVMVIDEEMRSLLSRGAAYNEIRDAARKNGMDTIFEVGLKRVEEGVTSLDEALGVTASA